VNFCIFSKNCYGVDLLLFDDPDDAAPKRVIRLDPALNKTFYYWHVFVRGLRPGQLCGYRVYGPFDPSRGLLFDGSKLLIDPYSNAGALGRNYDRKRACMPGDNLPYAPKSVIVDPSDYDWEGDEPLKRTYDATVIYEMHVGGFTRNRNSGVSDHKRGTYAGLVDKIDYLSRLGVTAVELMPVQQFDEQDARHPLRNYWGYSPMAFFAPHAGYSSCKGPMGAVNEFRDMVKALHSSGIEVIIDVVFNHTSEAGHDGPTFSFRGLENTAYYIYNLQKQDFENYTGCGNTINSNYSVVRKMIMECLRYWVTEMHVDGFRFDLASAMSRGELGEPLERPPILWSIESDPVLAGTKVIAEAWDAAGLYQVGSFIGDRFAEWNSHFRDDVRCFVKGDTDMVSRLSGRMLGSPDIYTLPEREMDRSINFITCHDGSPERPSILQLQAQPGQPRKEPRRVRPQLQLELRCRRPRNECRRRETQAQADKKLLHHPAHKPGHSHDPHGRRGEAHPGGQQQRLLPGQRADLVRLGSRGGEPRPPAIRQGANRLHPGDRRVPPEALPREGSRRL
jgi:glycogen operon protein